MDSGNSEQWVTTTDQLVRYNIAIAAVRMQAVNIYVCWAEGYDISMPARQNGVNNCSHSLYY